MKPAPIYYSTRGRLLLFRDSTVKTAVVIFTGLVLYFIVMKALGLAEILWLRVFNLLFLASGIYYALNAARKKEKDGLEYLDGILIGIKTSLISVGLFTLFIGVYLSIDPEFMNVVLHNRFGVSLVPFSAAVIVFIEGFVSGLMLTYILMPKFKK